MTFPFQREDWEQRKAAAHQDKHQILASHCPLWLCPRSFSGQTTSFQTLTLGFLFLFLFFPLSSNYNLTTGS